MNSDPGRGCPMTDRRPLHYIVKADNTPPQIRTGHEAARQLAVQLRQQGKTGVVIRMDPDQPKPARPNTPALVAYAVAVFALGAAVGAVAVMGGWA